MRLLLYHVHIIIRLFAGQRCEEGKILVTESRIEPWTVRLVAPRASIYAKRRHSREGSSKGLAFACLRNNNIAKEKRPRAKRGKGL